MPLVGVVIGSSSDAPLIQETLNILEKLGIEYELRVISAHRTPERARQYALEAEGRGVEVLIAAAGMAAHLPGVLASWSALPIIGVPIPSGELHGIDALLSIVQMPPGSPVASVGIGSAGAKNAAYLAAQILALKYDKINEAYKQYRQRLAKS